ncbi:MAG: glycosyltransferase family 4 protein [Pyrinomonadaceae bacterium MAG19_C2-C3]|nr:glycosyltransferase family 4 protein [Pyrinomonadaceae bacterium MAG19_C2-C3]
MNDSLRIGINAQLTLDDGSGGVAVATAELIAALGRLNLDDGHGEEYIIIGSGSNSEWLEPFIKGAQRIVDISSSAQRNPRRFKSLRRVLRPVRSSLTRWHDNAVTALPPAIGNRLPPSGMRRSLSRTQAALLNLECDVMHFPSQDFIQHSVPCVYNPHDLQHLHYPQFFTPAIIKWRESVYRAGCKYSETIAVGSQWIKQDLINHYAIKPDKIQVIPWSAPTRPDVRPTGENLTAVREKYDLTAPFALYPAVTWQHKNHLRLIESVARLRATKGIVLPIVCTGHHTEFYKFIKRHLKEYDVERQIHFPGHVSAHELRALYRMAQFVVIPTLFEAASGPLFEAWRELTPVTCAAVTSLPEQAAAAALLFDPFSVESITAALHKMSSDVRLREELVERGTRRLGDFSWARTARAYRAVYKQAAGRRLSDDERRLLNWDWMREPQRLEV